MCVIVLQRKCPLAIISKWRKVKTLKTLSTFLTFFDMALQKRKKVAFFWILKKHKKRILELCIAIENSLFSAPHPCLTPLLRGTR